MAAQHGQPFKIKYMQIESFLSAEARIIDEPSVGLKIEADIKIYNGKATDISNGQVMRDDVIVAGFSSFSGVNHRTYYGEPNIDEQIEMATIVDTFCNAVREKDYLLKAQ